MTDWQPFATVPRMEEKRVLLWSASPHFAYPIVAEWQDGLGWWDGDVYHDDDEFTHWGAITPPDGEEIRACALMTAG